MIKKHAQVGQKMRVDEINPARMKGGRASIGSWHGGVEGEWGENYKKSPSLPAHVDIWSVFLPDSKHGGF